MELKVFAAQNEQIKWETDVALSNTIQTRSMFNAVEITSSVTARNIELLSTRQALKEIKTDWRQLEVENAGITTVFQSYDWTMAWCDAYLSAKTEANLHVLVGKSAGKVVFILPLIKTRRHGLNVLDWLTDPIGQYGDVLCDPNQDAKEWLKASFKLLIKSKGIDIVRLRHVRANGNAYEFAKKELYDGKLDERAPFLDLTTFATEADYDKRYTSTQRKRRKKIRKALDELGPVNFRAVNSASEAEKLIEDSIHEKNAWLSDRGRFNRVMGCHKHIEFLKQLAKLKSESFTFLATELSADGKPVSWEIAFRYHGTHFAYITSHVNTLTDLSPGRLHMDLSQRQALADKLKTFDLMVPHDLHKDSWSSGSTPTNDYFMPVTVLGKIYGFVYLRTLRPLIRTAYYSLPTKALRLLQTLTRH